ERLADAAAQGGATLRAGIATAPLEGASVDAIIDCARAALRTVRSPKRVACNPEVTAMPQTSAILVSPVMRNVYSLVERVAESNITVLIIGETGAGKELVAEAIAVNSSSRKDQPFVKLNCASLPETLLESELFGHERGSFTGADRRKLGFFEAANGGTLFLDEIGEFPLNLQAKLLRVLESKKITRVGGTDEISVDTRVVAATHRDLEAEVKAGRFREDLYFRISAFTVMVPPLRDRSDEIIPLAEHFARSLGNPNVQLSDEARAALLAHDWPGNVRELRNAIERAVVIQSEGVINAADLPERIKEAGLRADHWTSAAAPQDGAMRDQLGAVERAALMRALESVGNNQTRAAKALGISRRALIYKMEKYGLKAPPNPREEA
ncbi:MAG TPA: sigma 54-interacting transcriptional regulator, partial [Kofleriaceae bacterium]|nr:sigma 54-interacting transcriptional regulator [Kofleriaceae bacterium]